MTNFYLSLRLVFCLVFVSFVRIDHYSTINIRNSDGFIILEQDVGSVSDWNRKAVICDDIQVLTRERVSDLIFLSMVSTHIAGSSISAASRFSLVKSINKLDICEYHSFHT